MDLAGKLPGDQNKFLCVVGSRNHSQYGKDACKKLIAGLRGYPVVIVSGLAVGIDSASHEAALAAGLKTIAFPGSGLSDRALYPPSRKDLAARILAAGGALLSPFDFDQEGAIWTFPTRNRLMAGIAHAALIVEAKKGSGTLITADHATEFNRDILAVPGSIFSEHSYGPHMLIQRGAAPVTSSEDILEALGFTIARPEPEQQQLSAPAKIMPPLSPEERSLVDQIMEKSLSASDLLQKIPMSPSTFNMLISELELKGIVTEACGIYKIRDD